MATVMPVTTSLVVLLVCRANVCRSPLAATLLRERAQQSGFADVLLVRSAGTDAEPGVGMCEAADAWSGHRHSDHRADLLTTSMLKSADLVLAVDRENRAICAQMVPAIRSRLFTLRQAAFLATELLIRLTAGAGLEGSPEVPSDRLSRLHWLVGEMDAARVLLAAREGQSDDIRDQHGPDPHVVVFEEVDEATQALISAFAECLAWAG